MKDNYTDVIAIIDRSGSMSNLRQEVIGGYNSFIKTQREVKGECTVSLIQFDDRYEPNYIGVPINDVSDLTMETYQPR